MLSLWQNDVEDAPQPGERPDLPVSLGESFEAAWHVGQTVSELTAGENARMEALQNHIDEIRKATGKDVTPDITLPFSEGTVNAEMLLPLVNDAAAKLGQPELTPQELERRANAVSQQALSDEAALNAREQTFGSKVGAFLGATASALADPVNLVGLAIAPEAGATSVLSAALRWGAIAGVSQAAIEAGGAPYREEVQPGYLKSGAPVAHVLEAAGEGAILGGSLRALGNAWTRVKTGAWPQSVRDAGNVVESEANIAGSNVYPGADGEVAHRLALSTAIDAVLGERPVDVSHIITPEIEAASRNVLMRLESERGMALPIFDERAVRLLSEEAQLRDQDTALATQLAALPEGDESAADRLNRLQAIEQQLAAAPDREARRPLLERRDQILVDTTPEALQQAAAPLAQRRALEAQRNAIAARLADIEAERAQRRLGPAPAPLGQTAPALRGATPDLEGAVAIAMRRPIVETPMPSGANSTRDLNGPVYVDPRVPEPLRRPVAVHETVEQVLMDRGLPYAQAHAVATQAEKEAVEAAGMRWEKYTHEWDGLLSGIEHEKVSDLPADLHVDPEAAIGHHGAANKQVRAVPIMQARALAARLAEEAKAAGREASPVGQLELPFAANAAVARMRSADEMLAGGVQQIARRAGYEMPDAEAAEVAARLVKASPDEADGILRDLQVSPRQAARAPAAADRSAQPAPVAVEPPERIVGSPDYENALRADIDRERMNADARIPVDVDKDGNPVWRSLDAAMDEVDGWKAAADEIQACATAAEPLPAAAE